MYIQSTLNAIPVKIPMALFTEIQNKQKNPESHMEPRKIPNNQSSPELEQTWRHHTLGFQINITKLL